MSDDRGRWQPLTHGARYERYMREFRKTRKIGTYTPQNPQDARQYARRKAWADGRGQEEY